MKEDIEMVDRHNFEEEQEQLRQERPKEVTVFFEKEVEVRFDFMGEEEQEPEVAVEVEEEDDGMSASPVPIAHEKGFFRFWRCKKSCKACQWEDEREHRIWLIRSLRNVCTARDDYHGKVGLLKQQLGATSQSAAEASVERGKIVIRLGEETEKLAKETDVKERLTRQVAKIAKERDSYQESLKNGIDAMDEIKKSLGINNHCASWTGNRDSILCAIKEKQKDQGSFARSHEGMRHECGDCNSRFYAPVSPSS